MQEEPVVTGRGSGSVNVPGDRKYLETHEWFLVDGDTVVMGITPFAADALTDITYVELPEIGTTVDAGGTIGEIESVKATSEIFSAVDGEIVEINTALKDHPELINDKALEDGWLVKIRPASLEPLESLMTAEDYASLAAGAN